MKAYVNGPLSIIHCLRAPIGGLFRHVNDLATQQSGMGHRVGIVCDAQDAGEAGEATLRTLAETVCELGVHRIKMNRLPGLSDMRAWRAVARLAQQTDVQILHGHGAKGGAYARLAARLLRRKSQKTLAFYTPHGGSLHYAPDSLQGRIFLGLEKLLAPSTDGLIFESAFSARVYETSVGSYPCETRIIPNGLNSQEFYEVAIDPDAADFVFVGELRDLKGIDILLEALAQLCRKQPVRAFIAGGGPDEKKFLSLAKKLGLEELVRFAGPTPAASAFTRGRCLIVPSRAESFPYIVLEAAAACLPVIATDVGGIPEIVEGTSTEPIPPDDVDRLTSAMQEFLDNPAVYVAKASALQKHIANKFRADAMAEAVTGFYKDKLQS